MSKVRSAHSVSVDGYLTGRNPGHGRGLGDATMLFDWYFSGDTPSQVFDGFRLSPQSADVFDAVARGVGATVAGRTTYDDSGWAAGGTPHPDAPMVVLSHRPAPATSRTLKRRPETAFPRRKLRYEGLRKFSRGASKIFGGREDAVSG